MGENGFTSTAEMASDFDKLFNLTDDGNFDFVDNNSSTNASSNVSTTDVIMLPEYTAITSLILCSLVLAVGSLGNLLVIIVILRSKTLRSSSTNLFLLNLSVADLLVLVTCTPTALVEIATRKDAWILGKVMSFNIHSV